MSASASTASSSVSTPLRHSSRPTASTTCSVVATSGTELQRRASSGLGITVTARSRSQPSARSASTMSWEGAVAASARSEDTRSSRSAARPRAERPPGRSRTSYIVGVVVDDQREAPPGVQQQRAGLAGVGLDDVRLEPEPAEPPGVGDGEAGAQRERVPRVVRARDQSAETAEVAADRQAQQRPAVHVHALVHLVDDPAALAAQDVDLVTETGQGGRDVVRVAPDAVPHDRRVLLAQEEDPHAASVEAVRGGR